MILNAPPTLMRVYIQPKETANLHPYDMAGWWVAGRAELTQPVDAANSEANAWVVRAARPRWPRLRRADRAKGAASQSVHSCDLGFGAAKS